MHDTLSSKGPRWDNRTHRGWSQSSLIDTIYVDHSSFLYRKTNPFSLKYSSILFLKTFKEELLTIDSGSWFQFAVTLLLKKDCLNLVLLCFVLYLCPLTTLLLENSNMSFMYPVSWPCTNLKVSIRSPLSLLYLNENMSNFFSLCP